jgi:hypothetical protein
MHITAVFVCDVAIGNSEPISETFQESFGGALELRCILRNPINKRARAGLFHPHPDSAAVIEEENLALVTHKEVPPTELNLVLIIWYRITR